jgi:hypothetical protein
MSSAPGRPLSACLAPGIAVIPCPFRTAHAAKENAVANLPLIQRVSWISEKLETRESPIHGRGLYLKAGAVLEQDEIVTVAGGRILTGDTQDNTDHAFTAAPGFLIGPLSEDDIDYYMNHSCEPNCGMAGSVAWCAMRRLEGPLELTYDYCMGEAWDDWAMFCRCGVPGCRGHVSGQDWRSLPLQDRYWGYFAPHVEARILAVRLGPDWREQLRAFVLGARPRTP